MVVYAGETGGYFRLNGLNGFSERWHWGWDLVFWKEASHVKPWAWKSKENVNIKGLSAP